MYHSVQDLDDAWVCKSTKTKRFGFYDDMFLAQQYSYINMKIIIGTILQHFIIESDETVKTLRVTTDISIRPVNGHLIRLKERMCL